MSDGSVSRYMTNDVARRNSGSSWPLYYYTSGYQCSDLLAQRRSGGTSARSLIDQARQSLGIDCDAGSQLGAQVAPVWDAVALAQTLLTDGTPKDLSQLSGTLRLAGKPGAGSDLLTVYHGRVSSGGIPITKLCVQHLAQGPRSSATCDTAFPVPPVPGSTS
jgi:hypothetical protein